MKLPNPLIYHTVISNLNNNLPNKLFLLMNLKCIHFSTIISVQFFLSYKITNINILRFVNGNQLLYNVISEKV